MIARGGRPPVVSRLTLQELFEENAMLREENAELRMERQRLKKPIDVVADLHVVVDEACGNGRADDGRGDEDHDDAMAVFLRAESLRSSLVIACENLETALGQVRRQLAHDIPAPEMDRRVRGAGDRRARSRSNDDGIDLDAGEQDDAHFEPEHAQEAS